MVNRRFRAAVASLALAACTAATPEYVIEVELIADPPLERALLEAWRADCRAYPAAVRPDLLISVSPNAAGGIHVYSAGGDTARFFAKAPGDGIGIPSAAPTIEREWTFDDVTATARAIPFVVDASMPSSRDVSRFCALLDPDQRLLFQDVADLHRALTRAGFRYVQLRPVEANP